MGWFLCTVAKGSERNWTLCKEVGLWGVSTHGKTIRFDRVRRGDRLLIWIAGKGYAASARVTDDMRRPTDAREAPWPEGLHRYGAVVPMEVDLELTQPLMLPFNNHRQAKTGINLYAFRRGFIAIHSDAAEEAVRVMREATEQAKGVAPQG